MITFHPGRQTVSQALTTLLFGSTFDKITLDFSCLKFKTVENL